MSALDFECLHGDHCAKQTRPEMELVLLAGAVAGEGELINDHQLFRPNAAREQAPCRFSVHYALRVGFVAGMGAKAMQFTKFKAAITTYLSESSGTTRCSQLASSTFTKASSSLSG